MPETESSWRNVTLGELCMEGGGNIQTGPFGSQLHAADYVASGIPSVMPLNIGDNIIVEEDIARITEADAMRLQRYRLAEGDIVYSRRGDVEKRALVRSEHDGWLCGTGCLRVRLGDRGANDSRFVSFLLGVPKTREWISQHAVGATMPNLNTGILSSVPLRVPGLETQRSIAAVLGALEDKIACNFRVANFAHALAEAKFASLMKEARTNTTVGSVLTLEYGKPLPAPNRVPGGVDVFGSGGIVGSHDQPFSAGPGVIVGRKGTAGAVHWASGDYYPIDTTFYVKPHDGAAHSMIFCYYLLRSLRLTEQNSDSAVPGLNRNEAHALKISLPDTELTQGFAAVAMPLTDVAVQADRESAVLAATRDELLPQLMSGKLRVRDAEKVLEGVL